MTANALKLAVGSGSNKSPTDPQECCDWANNRMFPTAFDLGYRWVVTGNRDKPIALVRAA